MDRATSSRGSPFISVSTGTVISRSTSSAAWPGHWDDLHLGRREVGIGIDRQPGERPEADGAHGERGGDHEERLRERSADQAVDPGALAGALRRSLRPGWQWCAHRPAMVWR